MIFEITPLTARERAHVAVAPHVDAHSNKRFGMSDGRHNQVPIIFEPDKAAVKEMIDAWC